MSSPKARRRQRSTRLTVAVALTIIAAAAVIGAVLAGSWAVLTVAALLGVALGAAAVRLTHSELLQTRRDANRDRAEQARAYRELSSERAVEQASFVAGMERKLAAHHTTIEELEVALTSAQRRAADAARRRTAEANRAELAETRAAEAIVRVAELEAELDVARAELDAVRAELAAWESQPIAKRA